MDKLDIIFQMQKELNKYIIDKHNLHDTPKDKFMQMLALAAFEEIMEVMNEVQYKWWKVKKPIDTDALKEELVDVLHFFVSMCLMAGMSSDDLFDTYLKKNEENYLRQKGLSEKKGYAQQDNE